MTKNQVVMIRDGLKAGKNIPLRISIDNAFDIIDESMKFEFVKWDDSNEVLYHIRLADPASNTFAMDKMAQVTVFAVSYEFIQAIEAPRVFVQDKVGRGDLADILDSLSVFGDDFKNLILHTYGYIRDKNVAHITPIMVNDLLGNKAFQDNLKDNAVNASDDYVYTDGQQFVQNYKETAHVPYTHETAMPEETEESDSEEETPQEEDDNSNG